MSASHELNCSAVRRIASWPCRSEKIDRYPTAIQIPMAFRSPTRRRRLDHHGIARPYGRMSDFPANTCPDVTDRCDASVARTHQHAAGRAKKAIRRPSRPAATVTRRQRRRALPQQPVCHGPVTSPKQICCGPRHTGTGPARRAPIWTLIPRKGTTMRTTTIGAVLAAMAELTLTSCSTGSADTAPTASASLSSAAQPARRLAQAEETFASGAADTMQDGRQPVKAAS